MAAKCFALAVAVLVFSTCVNNVAATGASMRMAKIQKMLMKKILPGYSDSPANLRATPAKDSYGLSAAKDLFEMPSNWTSTHVGELEDAVAKLALSKAESAFGATPFGESVKKILWILEERMIPDLRHGHKTDQDELDELAGILGQCDTQREALIELANGFGTTYAALGGAEGAHLLCREGEAGFKTALSDCQATLSAKQSVMDEKCGTLSTVDADLGADSAHIETATRLSESTKVYLQRMADAFCGLGGGCSAECGTPECGYNCQYLCAETACNEATESRDEWTTKCDGIQAQYDAKKTECNNIQDQMDKAACKQAVGMKDACEKYGDCYESKRKSYDELVEVVKQHDFDRYHEWSGLKRMHCIIGGFEDGKVTKEELEECAAKDHSEGVPEIEYPAVSELTDCEVGKMYPNTPEYKEDNFARLPSLAKGKEDEFECTGVEEISTAPADGSPETCECTRVTLSGPFSPGPLVKCTNCLDVKRSAEFNSCPAGTKLFAPRSREDWQSFIGSVSPSDVKAPNFIIDVTRPENGCGGCETNAMNSGNHEQASWRTEDLAAWWLRSTTFSEPNGDYTADCYLDVTGFGHEDAIEMKDNGCSYHSKSYFCQLQLFTSVPKEGSPEGCMCERVALTKTYSAGVLLKCTSCLRVSKTTDKNSCPEGFKIFSPRSRADWQAVIESIAPLKSPSWIVDVTRPANGCGSCADEAMNSDNSGQKTWVTSDGSAWWLRSTTYAEPASSADYQANCYMDLLSTPVSENMVVFKADRCNMNSDAYYCQRVQSEVKGKEMPPEEEDEAEAAMIVMKSDHPTHNAKVAAYKYKGASQTLTWDVQRDVCHALGLKVPGSSHTSYMNKYCSYSASENWAVTATCNWASQGFSHVSGSMPSGKKAYMCAHLNCDHLVIIEGEGSRTSSHGSKQTINDGDAVFCQPKPAAGVRMKSAHNSNEVVAYTYEGEQATLTWDIQNTVCESVNSKVPGSSHPSYMNKYCSYSSPRNYEVTSGCNWGSQAFDHVSGSVPSGNKAYMCAHLNCDIEVKVTGEGSETSNSGKVTIYPGDSVFCEPSPDPTVSIAISESGDAVVHSGDTVGPDHIFEGHTANFYIGWGQGSCSLGSAAEDAEFFCSSFYNGATVVSYEVGTFSEGSRYNYQMHKKTGCTSSGTDISSLAGKCAGVTCKIWATTSNYGGLYDLVCRLP